jgi:hypothetical protein
VAEDPDRLCPATDVKADYDVVCIVGSPPLLPANLEPFLEEDDPSVAAIHQVLAIDVRERLRKLWIERASGDLCEPLARFGDAWVTARCAAPWTAAFRLYQQLAPSHASATQWLTANHLVYFEALEAMWLFGRWRRTFYIRYLAKYFRVGVFGYDWSAVGMGPGGWVNHDDQPKVYTRGKVVLNISQAGDEEGISHKPFQIAASGVAMAHIDAAGMTDCFLPGEEAALFRTPHEARELIAALVRDDERRSGMAQAARSRLCRDHTWDRRLAQMLCLAGVRGLVRG